MATVLVPGAGGLNVIPRGAARSSASAPARVRLPAVSCTAPVRRRAVWSAAPSRARRPPPPLVHGTTRPPVRVPPARCQPPAASESPLEPPRFWQKVKQVWKSISWKCVATLLLLVGCTAVGYFTNKGDPWAEFIVDVLDKANKTYKPTLEFAALLIAIIISLSLK